MVDNFNLSEKHNKCPFISTCVTVNSITSRRFTQISSRMPNKIDTKLTVHIVVAGFHVSNAIPTDSKCYEVKWHFDIK
jgi:hypothetical protein